MTIKRFLQNKIHIYLLIISLILSIIVFTGEKYSLEDKEIDLYVGIEDNLNKVLSKSLSLRDYNALIYEENTDNDLDYLKEDKGTIEEIKYYLTLNNIISEIIQSFSQEKIPASGFIEKVPAKKMDKPAFMKGQKELIDFYKSTRDKSYSLLEPGDMTFLVKRYDYLSNSKVEVLDENGKVYLNSIIARKSDYLFSAPILIIVSLIGAFVLKQDKIALKLKENLFVLKLKASLFYAAIVLIFCTSIFLFLGLLSWIFGSGIGPFDYIYFNPQIIDGLTTYITEKPIGIFIYKGTIFIILTTIFSAVFNLLSNLFNRFYFKVLIFVLAAMLFISQLIDFNIMKGLVNHPMGLVNIIKKLNFSDLVAIDWLKLLFGIILAILCLKLSIFIEIKESKSSGSELIIRKPFTISFYTKYYFVKYCPYILLIPLLFISVLSSRNNEHLEFFDSNFEINLKSYKKDYDYQRKVLENHHETFNSVRGLTDEKRSNLDEDEKMELDYYEETELEEQKNILDESRIRYEHLLSFSNRDKDPKKYYNLEKEAIKNHPLLLYNTMLRDMELSDKTIPLNIDYVSEYEKRNLPTPKTFLGPIFSNFDSNNYIKLDYLIMEYFFTGLIKNNDAFAFLYNFFHIKLGLLLIVIISLITNVFLWF